MDGWLTEELHFEVKLKVSCLAAVGRNAHALALRRESTQHPLSVLYDVCLTATLYVVL